YCKLSTKLTYSHEFKLLSSITVTSGRLLKQRQDSGSSDPSDGVVIWVWEGSSHNGILSSRSRAVNRFRRRLNAPEIEIGVVVHLSLGYAVAADLIYPSAGGSTGWPASPSVPAGLLTVPFLENVNKFQNPFRRPVATTVFLIGTAVALWLGIGATLPIDKSLTLGLF
ncbi:hypothetical protein RJ640_010082, partial [Escallonia rubra]